MISVKRVSKYFGPKCAVDDVTFEVKKGEVLGFLGPNGAGKSTTMRMITGYLPPASGSIRVGEFDVASNPLSARRLIGYLPENAPAYPDMTVSSFLAFAAEMRGLYGSEKEKAVSRVLEMCFLQPVRHQSIDTLSKGYRHRTCFAQSILHDPDVLIMDEPTDGLDPNQKHEVRSLIRSMGENKAIIFSTHILEEVEAVCSRAIIIDRGRVVANGTPDELKERAPDSGAVKLVLVDAGEPEGVNKALASVDGVKEVSGPERSEEGILTYFARGKKGKKHATALADRIAALVREKQWKARELVVEEGRLDDVFRSITLPDDAREVGRKEKK